MRVLKHRNLLGCLFAFILAMPLINIGVRCAYITFNKNAKDSYSGLNENSEEVINVSTVNDFDYSKTYYIGNSQLDSIPSSTSSSAYMYFDNVNIKYNGTSYTDEQLSSIDRLYFYLGTNNTIYYNFYINDTNISLNSGSRFIFEVNIRSIIGSDNAINNLNFVLSHSNTLYYIDYFIYDQLDNAFSYSVSQVTEGNNIGELKFFTWFAGLFLDLDNSTNALYVNFINWYFNYALLVSAVYILFLALMWFIMWVRRLLERGMDFGRGSF